MSPILNVKWMKWTLNRIHYYYKTLHTNLHYFNVSVGQCERHLSNSIDYCKYYQPSMDTLATESPLACLFFFCLLTRLILIIWYTNIYIYIQWVRKIFRPPYIFHSLLYCSHLLKSFVHFFSSLMYTQHPILTEKHRIVDIFADLLKKQNWNITWS